jgi:hypothetical protein
MATKKAKIMLMLKHNLSMHPVQHCLQNIVDDNDLDPQTQLLQVLVEFEQLLMDNFLYNYHDNTSDNHRLDL